MTPRPRLAPLLSALTSRRMALALPQPPANAVRALATGKISTIPEPPPPRWLGDLRARIGKCVMFGCSPAQVAQAATVLRALSAEWRALVAGSEGFLTGGRRGLEGHRIVWGEMDSFVRAACSPTAHDGKEVHDGG